MIECPICHVMNDDQSHFCSECGQRFSPSQATSGSGSVPSGVPQQSWQGLPPGYVQSGNPAVPPQPAAPAAPPSVPPGFGSPQAGINQDMFAPAPQPSEFEQNNSIFGLSPVQPGGAAPQPQSQFQQQPQPPMPVAPSQPMPSSPQTNQDPLYAEPSASPSTPPTSFSEAAERVEPPKRPRLHSPILHNTAMLEPVSDDDDPPPPKSQDSARRGGALRSPLLGGDDDHEPPARPAKGRGGLRSPLLGADADDEEPPQSQSQSRGKGGLRSPLLRGEDDPDARPNPRGGSSKPQGLRSPLLGGDDDSPKRGGFPHRSQSTSQPMDYDSDEEYGGKPAKGGLRSPLLGGAGDDDYEPRRSNQPRQGEASMGGRRRMRSPLIDGTGDYSYDQDQYDEEPDYDENDPNVLRSPLLAARQKLHEQKAQSQSQPQAPTPQQAIPQEQQFARDRGFAEPRPNQAEFRDRGFPDVSQPATPAAPPAPPDYAAPPQLAQQMSQLQYAPQQPPEPMRTAPAPDPVPPPEPPSAAPRKGRSAMLPPTEHNEHRVPLSIYDSGIRDTVPGQPVTRSGPSLILIVPSALALLIKGMYLMDLLKLKGQVLPSMMLNEVGQAAVLVAIIIFGLTASKK